MTLASILAELLELAVEGPPSAEAIRARFAERATAIATGDASLSRPGWARGTRGPSDVFLTLNGPLVGMAIWEDFRGWGAYAELAVADGSLAEVEAVVGPTSPMPRNPDDFSSGNRVAAYVPVGGKTVRVFTELERDERRVRRVTLHFQR